MNCWGFGLRAWGFGTKEPIRMHLRTLLSALLVIPGDAAALADALDTLVTGGPAVDRLRRRGPDVAAAYTWERSAAAHAEVYRSVLMSPLR